MNMYPELTPEERGNRLLVAERRVYDQLAASGLPGRTLYEVRPYLQAPQLDFWAIAQDIAHFGLQGKGGHYRLDPDGIWYLLGPGGPQQTANPLRQTWAATMALKDALFDRLGRKPFFIPVCIFPDMAQDQGIEDLAIQSKVHVGWGYATLIDQLMGFAQQHTIYDPPTAESIAEEVAAIIPVVQRPRPAAPAEAVAVELLPRQVIIENVTTVNIYITTGRDPEDGDGQAGLLAVR